jgi:DNA-binding SARP family transcriptional activator/tetratricopeptide (TPR) repeat protein
MDDVPRPLGGVKQRAVLAILILHRGEIVSGERLVDELWGERPPATAAKTLQGYVSRLRKALGDDLVQTRGRGYVLALSADQLDVDRFEQLASGGRAALSAGDAATAAERLHGALAVWRGAPLADFTYEPFAQAEIARLEEARLATLEDRIEADLELRRHGQLVAELESLVREHPLRERMRGQLMLALYRSGRQAEALDCYRIGRRALIDEVGIEPGTALRGLHQGILEQDPRLDSRSEIRLTRASAGIARAAGVFVGRERELAEMLGALEDVIAGQGRLFVLSGEPGIGKSRLAEELARHARDRGALVLVGRCWEAGGAPAFWPWVQSLRAYLRASDRGELIRELGPDAAEIAPILPELYELIPEPPHPAALDADGARFRLFYATAEFLRRASDKRPLVFVLDDLHAADTPSLLLVQFLARELAHARVLLLAALRDVDPTPGQSLSAMLAEVTREPGTRRVSLGGLSEPEIARYVELAAAEIFSPELAAALYAETDGNPLFVAETVRLLSIEGVRRQEGGEVRLAIPEGVRDVITRRLAHLSTGCHEVLVLASVLGREFTLIVLARVAATSEDRLLDTLDEAMEARVLAAVPGAPGRLRFAHVLIRDTLYERLTPARRVRLHRLVVSALEPLYGEEAGPHLAELAHHAIAASDFQRGLRYACRAGDRALQLLAYEEAERLYETALEAFGLAEVSDEKDHCELLLSLGEARARAGNTAAAHEAFLQAAELARRLDRPHELARAAAGYGGRIVWFRAGKDDRLVPLLESALAALPDNEVELRVRLLARLAGALRDELSAERRDRLGREAVELARRTGNLSALAYALDGHAAATCGGPGTQLQQLALGSELREVAARIGDRERVLAGHIQRFAAQCTLGEISEAQAELTAASHIAEELRQRAQLWQVHACWAMLALAAGRFGDAEELIPRAFELGEPVNREMAISGRALQLCTLRDFQGNLDQVEAAIGDAAMEYPARPVLRCAHAYLHARLGRTSVGQQALRDLAERDFAMLPLDLEWLLAMSLLAESCSLLADADTASIVYSLLVPHAALNAVDWPEGIRGSVSRYLGLLAATMGRLQDAATHFDHALAMNDSMGARPWLAHTQHEYARMLLTREGPGDHERAQELIDQALSTYRELHMTTYAESAFALCQQGKISAQPMR